jgi:hypothetical protein
LCCCNATLDRIRPFLNSSFILEPCTAVELPRKCSAEARCVNVSIFLGAKMLSDAIRLVRDPNVQRRIILAAVLLSGGAPFAGCTSAENFLCQFVNNASECEDPPVHLTDPNFHAGATVTLRTPAAGDSGVTLFARTGVLAPIDNTSTAATPAIAGVTPSGTASQRENITLPLYGGVTIPAKNVGVPIPNLSFEAFGGANFKNEKTGFTVNEAAGGTAFASQTYWTANPAAGAGIQYYLGTVWGVPTSLGAAYIVDFQLSDHNVTAASPSTPGLSYTLTNTSHISQTAAFTLNFDLPPK